MPFMVIYGTSDGTSCHEQADAIDEAALFVERLRNQDGIEEIRIFRMEEISFAFRPYYKVELGMPERLVIDSPPADVLGSAPEPAAQDEARVEVDEAEPAVTPLAPAPAEAPGREPSAADGSDPTGANGRRGLFGR